MNYELPEFELNFEALKKFLESNVLLYGVCLLLVLKIISTGVSVNLPGNIFYADITKSTLVNLANQSREAAGLNPLADNSVLDLAAQLKAEDMVKNQYFAHTSPAGITPWVWFTKAGYNYKFAGENLAIGFFDSQEVYNAWMNSPDHKANLMNPNYKEVGTAVLSGFGNNNTIVVVQIFGSQATPKTAIAKVSNNKPVAKTQTVKPITPSTENKQVEEKVLSQTTEIITAPSENLVTSNLHSKFMNYMLYNYNKVVQNAIFGAMLIIIGMLITLIFIAGSNLRLERKLVLRSALIIAILGFSSVFNEFVIILTNTAHQIKI